MSDADSASDHLPGELPATTAAPEPEPVLVPVPVKEREALRPLPRWLRSPWAGLALVALGFLLLAPRLAGFGLWDPYEVRLLEGATDVPTLAQLWMPSGAFKPRLPMLPIAWGVKHYGVSEIGGRAPMVVIALLALVAMLALGRALRRDRVGILGGFVLLTMPVFYLSARQVSLTLLPVLGQILAVTGLTLLGWPRRGQRAVDLGVGLVLATLGLGLGLLSCGALLGVVAPLAAVTLTLGLGAGPLGGRLVLSALLGAALCPPTRFLLTLMHAGAELHHGLGVALLVLALGAAVAGRGRSALGLCAAVFGLGVLLPLPELKSGYSPWLAGLAHWPATREVQVDTLLKPLGFLLLPWSALLPLAIASVFARWRPADAALAASADGTPAASAEGTPAISGEDVAADPGRTSYAMLLPVAWFAATYLLGSVQGALVTEPSFPAVGALALLTGQYLERLFRESEAELGAGKIAGGLCVALLLIILGRDLFFAPELLVSGQLTETLRWPAPLASVGQLLSTLGVGLGVWFGLAVLLAGSRRWVLESTLGVALVLALVNIHGLIPAVSHHVSYRGIYTKYQKLGGGALGIYGVPQSGSKLYGQNSQQLTSLAEVLSFLQKATTAGKRSFVIVGSGELAALDLTAREHKQSYYVVDASNSQFLLLSNQLAGGEADLNPLRKFISETPPKIGHPMSIIFDERIELLGYDAPDEVSRGDEIPFRMYFRVLQPTGGSYKLFLHFDGMGSRFNGDHVPLEGRFPTSYWATGHYITDEYRVPTSRLNQAPGYYQIFTGLWPGGEGARLKVTAGPHESDHRVRLGVIKVK